LYLDLPEKAELVGIDIDQKQLDDNPSLDDRILGDVQTYPLAADRFGLVICWDVLEHVPSPRLALENLRRAVAPGGLLVLAGPNLLSLKGLATRLTPYRFHRACYRWTAGDLVPFPTYLRYACTPVKIVSWAQESGLVIGHAAVCESPAQVQIRRKLRLTGRLWSIVHYAASALTLGFVDLAATDFALVLHKPT
jgi:SAM-dependent methyltransferase